MAKILLIETATEVCSVAIALDGHPVALAEEATQPNHAARLTLLIQECAQRAGMALSDLDAIAVSSGPGSYTSLRVGASVAKGICYALNKPLVAVDTLLALAAASHLAASPLPTGAEVFLVPMLDARRKEVWTAVFDDKLHLLAPAQPLILENNFFQIFLDDLPAAAPQKQFVVSGNGAKKLFSDLIFEGVVVGAIQSCSATHLALPAEQFFQRADFQQVAYFEPFYMKPPNITKSSKPVF